ncbi:response regulator transcription factor [Pseudomonadota bacterium]
MRVAIIEDDIDQARLLEFWLKDAGYECYLFDSGSAAIKGLQKETFDLVLLDWLLPDLNGDKVLAWIRENLDWRIPVIFVTQRDSEEDIAFALEHGADDYVVKPIKSLELKARIKALTRRMGGVERDKPALEFGVYRFETDHHQAYVNDQTVALTQKEFELAVFFFRNAGRLLSRSHLLESVWGHSAELNTRTLDTHISRLRKKLQFGEAFGYQLRSIYHHGYRLESSAEQSASD